MTRYGLIAQNHRTGIGIQCAELARHIEPTKVLVTDLSKLHAANSRNTKRVSSVDWFDQYNHLTVEGMPDEQSCRWLLSGIDVLFVVETPLNHSIFNWARELGVKTILQSNFEFVEQFLRPVPKPDLFLAPSKWNIDRLRQKVGNVRYMPVPIDTDRIKRREITQARKFIHITGHKAHLDRDGTEIVRQSIRYVKNRGVEIKVYDQSKKEVPNYWDLYQEGDVLLLPRRYGGLSLKLQEATAAGMPVVVSEHDPYAGKPCAVSIPGPYQQKTVRLRTTIDTYSASPEKLGETIDRLSSLDSIKDLSDKAYRWAQDRSWQVMKPKYEKLFEELCEDINRSPDQPASLR